MVVLFDVVHNGKHRIVVRRFYCDISLDVMKGLIDAVETLFPDTEVYFDLAGESVDPPKESDSLVEGAVGLHKIFRNQPILPIATAPVISHSVFRVPCQSCIGYWPGSSPVPHDVCFLCFHPSTHNTYDLYQLF